MVFWFFFPSIQLVEREIGPTEYKWNYCNWIPKSKMQSNIENPIVNANEPNAFTYCHSAFSITYSWLLWCVCVCAGLISIFIDTIHLSCQCIVLEIVILYELLSMIFVYFALRIISVDSVSFGHFYDLVVISQSIWWLVYYIDKNQPRKNHCYAFLIRSQSEKETNDFVENVRSMSNDLQ